MTNDLKAYPQDATASTAPEVLTTSIRNLSDSIFLPIESSSRNRMTKTMLQAQILSKLDTIAFSVANVVSASAPTSELSRRVKVVTLREALNWYGRVVSAASFADFDQKLSTILESRDDLATIQGIEDYDLFEVDHLPRLQRIVSAIRSIEDSLTVPELTDYTPTFTVSEFNRAMEKVEALLPASEGKDDKEAQLRIYVLSVLKTIFATDDELGPDGVTVTDGPQENTRITSMFDAMVLLDRALQAADPVIQGERKMKIGVFGIEEHVVLNGHSLLGLPVAPATDADGDVSMLVDCEVPSASGTYWNATAPYDGDEREKVVEGARYKRSVPLEEMLAMLVVHCAKDETERASAMSLCALPLCTHKLFGAMERVFAKAYKVRIPQIELNTFKLLEGLVTGGDSINSKDALVKFRAAINRDTSSVGHAVIDAYSESSVSQVDDLVAGAIEKMYVREPQLRETFVGTNMFRMDREVVDVMSDGGVTWGAPNPFQFRADHIITHPESFSEATIKVNRLSGERIVESTPISMVRPLLEDLHHFDKTVVSNVSRIYSIESIIDEINEDWNDRCTLAIGPCIQGDSVTVADTLVGVKSKTAGDTDSVEVYGTLQNEAHISLPNTRIRMTCHATVHKMWGGSGLVQMYTGPQAASDVKSWVQAAYNLVNNLIASYARSPIATQVDSFSVLPDVKNSKYRDRIDNISSSFMTFRETAEMRRFLSNPTVSRFMRDRLDVDLFVNPGVEYRINRAVSASLMTYANSVANAIRSTYKANSDTMDFLNKFLSGELTMVELSAMEHLPYSPIISATVEMLVGNISRENTLLSLLLIDHFVQAITNSKRK